MTRVFETCIIFFTLFIKKACLVARMHRMKFGSSQNRFEKLEEVKTFQKNLPEMTAEEILINNAQNGLDFEGLMYGEMKEREMLMATTELLQQARVSGIQLFRCYAAESLEMATEAREQGALTIPKTA